VNGGPVALRPLTLVDEADSVIVGDPATGQFIEVPPVGGVVIRALQRGASIEEAAAEAMQSAGVDVDVAEFVETLAELGFTETAAGQTPVRTAPVQQSRWLSGPPPALLRPFFSRPAWICYIAAFCFSGCCLAASSRLRLHSSDLLIFHDYLASLAAVTALSLALLTLHESGHWMAARALGLTARFSVDRRLIFFVAETDLSQLWAVPRRKRYGPLFAGMAVDSCVLAATLAVRLSEPAGWDANLAGRLVRAVTCVEVMELCWQALFFLRTDTYAVFVTATRCGNLWEVQRLLLRRAFGRASSADTGRLAEAGQRDIAIGTWFRWVYLTGGIATVGGYTAFVLPTAVSLLGRLSHDLASGPTRILAGRRHLGAGVPPAVARGGHRPAPGDARPPGRYAPGSQTDMAPGPRLSHWKYGIVTADTRTAGCSGGGGTCRAATLTWIVRPMPSRVTSCSVSRAPGRTASSSSRTSWSACSAQ
jgi:hypothetical protein